MSLINEMLRNLDEREGRARTQRVLPLEPSVPGSQSAGPARRHAAALGVAALACAAAALLWLGSPEVPTTPADAAPALPEVSHAPASEAPAAMRLRGMVLERTEQGTRLSLELSGSAAHRVVRSDGGRALEVVLPGTRLGSQIPPLDLRRSPIDSFGIEQRDSDLHLLLTLLEPARLQSGMQPVEDGARLSLDFTDAPARARAKAPSPAPPPAALEKAPAEPALVRTPRAPSPAEQAAKQHRRALDLVAAGESAGAEAALREALELDPALHEARTALVSIALADGRGDEAEGLLARGEGLAPGYAAFALLRARLLLLRGDAPAAVAALERSAPPLARDPEYHALHAALLADDAFFFFFYVCSLIFTWFSMC